MFDDLRLEEIVRKFKKLTDKLLEEPECTSGRSLAALYFQMFSRSLNGENTASKVCLAYLKDNLDTLLQEKETSIGVFLHSFVAQFALVALQFEVMSQNCIRWLDNQKYIRIPVRSVDELLEKIPCMKQTGSESTVENITLNEDLKQLWEQFQPEEQFRGFYMELIHEAVLNDDSGAKLKLLEIQPAINMVLDHNGGFVHRFAKAWYSYQLKLRQWLFSFLESSEDPSLAAMFKKHRMQKATQGQKSLRQVITEYQEKKGMKVEAEE